MDHSTHAPLNATELNDANLLDASDEWVSVRH